MFDDGCNELVAGVFVRLAESLQVPPCGATDFLPVVVRVEQPVLLLIAFRSRIQKRHIHDVEDAWVAPVLVLTFLL